MNQGYGTAPSKGNTLLELTPEEELHWLALLLVPGIGPRQGRMLVERYGTPRRIFEVSASELRSCGIVESAARSIASGCTFEDAVTQQQKLRELGGTTIPITHPLYPPLLRQIYDPPLLLMVLGEVELLQSVMVAIVGTRRPTPYGQAVAEKLAADLAAQGVTIVSGMARGIDTAAHRGALKAGGKTIAVFGSGLDVLYPIENKKLREEIAASGLLVSEFPLGTPAYPQNFPIRNRIISGMSAGVVIVEGAQYSGSAITARLALEQGREVFAVPGNITSKMSWGPNLLIKQGANLVQGWEDVVYGLPPDAREKILARNANESSDANMPDARKTVADLVEQLGPMAPLAREILGILKVDELTDLDQLLERIRGTSSSELLATLFELEVLGLVRQYPGMRYGLTLRT